MVLGTERAEEGRIHLETVSGGAEVFVEVWTGGLAEFSWCGRISLCELKLGTRVRNEACSLWD